MSAPTPTLSPATNINSWHFFLLEGFRSPGTIARGGIRGFERETGWDRKHGKGTKGATLTLTTQPPLEGIVTLQLNNGLDFRGVPSTDFSDLDAFVLNALSIAPEKQQAQGLQIFYPGFSSVGLTAVVVKKYGPILHPGKNLYLFPIELIEWQPPPPVSIVSTVKKTAPDQGNNQPVFQQPPDIQQRLNQIAALTQATKTT